MNDQVVDTVGLVIIKLIPDTSSQSSLWPITIAVIVCAVIICIMTAIIVKGYNNRHKRELEMFKEYRDKYRDSSNS